MNVRLNMDCTNAIDEITAALSGVTSMEGVRVEPTTMDVVTVALLDFAAMVERNPEAAMGALVQHRLS